MLRHLVDGDTASNNFSWQWVASTFSRKPYIFNLEEHAEILWRAINTDDRHNMPLAAGYDVLTRGCSLIWSRCDVDLVA